MPSDPRPTTFPPSPGAAGHAALRRIGGCRALRAIARGMRGIARWCGRQAALRRQRVALGRLDDRLLRDIGLDRAAAEREAAKCGRWPF